MDNSKTKINIDNIANEVCKSCGNDIWQQGLIIKKVSAILSTTGKEELASLPVVYCAKCKIIYHGYKEAESRIV